MTEPIVKFINLKQRYSWDCGLVCVEVITRALAKDERDAIYKSVVPGNVWTIDLAFILHRYELEFTYYTIVAGVNAEYSGMDFYKAALAQDAPRINKLFEDSKQLGIKVETRSLEIEMLKNHAKRRNPAIVLVDDRYIQQVKVVSTPTSEAMPIFDSAGYLGHYILVCGYHIDSDEFEYCDSTYSNGNLLRVPEDEGEGNAQLLLGPFRIKSCYLELARKSAGTDEDLLLVNLNK